MSIFRSCTITLAIALTLGLAGCGGSGGGGGTTTPVTTGKILVTQVSPGHTTESGGQATFTVLLDSQPAADVVIPIASDNTNEGTVSPASLTFNSTTWNIAQTVTVTGVADAIPNDNQTYHVLVGPSTSSDPDFNGLNGNTQTLQNLDVVTGILIPSLPSSNTDESGHQGTFTVKLNVPPSSAVTISLASSNETEGTVSPASLILDAGNFDSDANLVTVTGQPDGIADGNTAYSITLSSSSADGNFDGLSDSVSLTNIDLVDAYGVTPKISAGDNHNLVLANDGTVWGWGYNNLDQLDVTPSATYITEPRQLNNIDHAVDVAAGYAFSLIAKQDGTVWSSGTNESMQLGHVTEAGLAQVIFDQTFTGLVTKVAAGYRHSLALSDTGEVWGWGKNAAGQLGADTGGSNSITPVQAGGELTGLSAGAISAGQDHSMALAAGQVYTWGSNSAGQLGNGTTSTTPQIDPAAVSTPANLLTGATFVNAGQLHSFAIGVYGASDSLAWGDNIFRELGTTAGSKLVPTPIGGIIDDTTLKLSGGRAHSLALMPNGDVYAWGDNDGNEAGANAWDNAGALGDGTSSDRSTPTLTKFGTTSTFGVPAVDIAAGANYSIAMLADGRIRAAGKNNVYQLSASVPGGTASDFSADPVDVVDTAGSGPFHAYRPILAGYPAQSTTLNSATIQVCPAPVDCGPIVEYRYSTDNGSTWAAPALLATPITLDNLSAIADSTTGQVTLMVKGIDNNAIELQSDSSAVTVSWLTN